MVQIIISESNLLNIVKATTSHMGPRLISHGERVAFILYKMMQAEGGYSPEQIKNICMLGVLHDVGAYKTEEIDRMMEFESHNVWEHSIYGYIFMKAFSPLKPLCDSILYHHLSYDLLKDSACKNKDIADKIHLADRIDILIHNKQGPQLSKILQPLAGHTFSAEGVELFFRADKEFGIVSALEDGSAVAEINQVIGGFTFTGAEVTQYLHMIVNFIDFRSEFTVAHTMMTVQFSVEIARHMHLDTLQQTKIYWGAQFHDLGKIVTPVEILEKQGGLTRGEMEIMKQHVVHSREILETFIDPEILEIAVRHHETLDGSGYPQGLTAEQLTTEQRILAVGDVMSALLGKRSYKKQFSKDTTLNILTQMARNHKLCPDAVEVVTQHFDEIVNRAQKCANRNLEQYRRFWDEFLSLQQYINRTYPQTLNQAV